MTTSIYVSGRGFVELELTDRVNVFLTPFEVVNLQEALMNKGMSNEDGDGWKLPLSDESIVLAGYANSLTVTVTVDEYINLLPLYIDSPLDITRVI